MRGFALRHRRFCVFPSPGGGERVAEGQVRGFPLLRRPCSLCLSAMVLDGRVLHCRELRDAITSYAVRVFTVALPDVPWPVRGR